MMKQWGDAVRVVTHCENSRCARPFKAHNQVFIVRLSGGYEYVFCSERCVIVYLLNNEVESHSHLPMRQQFRRVTFLPGVGKGGAFIRDAKAEGKK